MRGHFTVYGTKWPFATRFLQPPSGAAAYRGCRIAINHSNFHYERHSSNRLFRAMGSGAFVLNRQYPDQETEMTDGEHLVCWDSLEDLRNRIDYYMERPRRREEIAAAGCASAHKEWTWKSRMEDFRRIMGMGVR